MEPRSDQTGTLAPSSPAPVPARCVCLNGLTRASPYTVRPLEGVQPPSLCRLTQSSQREVLGYECGQWHQPSGAGHVGNDDPVQFVMHRPCDQFAKRTVVICVGSLHRGEVRLPLPLEDDDRWVAEADKDEVQDESSGSSISVNEGVDSLKFVVDPPEFLWDRPVKLLGRDSLARLAHVSNPGVGPGWNQGPRRRNHAGRERMDVVLPEVAWALLLGRLGMRGDVPNQGHGRVMDMADLLEGEEVAFLPLPRFECLSVHPLSGLSVPPDLHVLA